MTMLEFRKISFNYSVRPIFESVSFSVPAGETVALVGANGAGKTTLLKICAGLLIPQRGEALFDGRLLSLHSRREIAKRIALVPQEVQVSFDFTVEHLVQQGRTPHLSLFASLKQADRRVVENAMQITNVRHLRNRNFNDLSGGERQRVKIALALAQEPQLLLLDEPAQHLDIARQAEIFSLLHRLNSAGMTIIAAVHDLHCARQHFSSALLLRPDLSAGYGPTDRVLSPDQIRHAFGVSVTDDRLAWTHSITEMEKTYSCASSEYSSAPRFENNLLGN